jgi:hypothetical protein
MEILLEKYIPELENRDLLFISYDKNIPSNYNGISCSLSLDENGRIIIDTIIHKKPDPSTIWVYLPIKKEEYVAPLSYFPHYIDLMPEQRYTYLNWLRKIDTPIDIGYVFLYFYGLERHLLLGDIDRAITQIIRLRNHHQNKSFCVYTRNSIIHACIMRNRIDLLLNLQELTKIEGFTNAQLLLAKNLGFGLSVNNLIDIFYKLYPKSRKAIKENSQLFNCCVNTTLMDMFQTDSLSVSDIDLSQSPTIRENRFCNYTFPEEIRFVEITDFYRSESFLSKINLVFDNSYERYKSEKNKSNGNNKN